MTRRIVELWNSAHSCLAEIVGLSQAWEALPDDVPVWLGLCSTAFRRAAVAHDGREFPLAGEQLGAAFDTSEQAVLAGIDTQRQLLGVSWAGSDEISVRMAVHGGDAHLIEDRFVGPALTFGLDLLEVRPRRSNPGVVECGQDPDFARRCQLP